MSMEEQAALAELRRMIRQLLPERQQDFKDAYDAITDYHAAHGDLGSVAMQIFLLENCSE